MRKIFGNPNERSFARFDQKLPRMIQSKRSFRDPVSKPPVYMERACNIKRKNPPKKSMRERVNNDSCQHFVCLLQPEAIGSCLKKLVLNGATAHVGYDGCHGYA
jgi:hypothetical protein